MLRRRGLFPPFWVFLLLGGLFHSSGSSCNTPVHRFAMYQWQPATYHLVQLGGLQDPERWLGKHPHANITLDWVVREPTAIATLPGPVQEIANAHEEGEPLWILTTGVGEILGTSPVRVAELEAMLDSPVRRELAEVLSHCPPCAFVLLEGADEKQNELASREMRQAITAAASGRLPDATPYDVSDDKIIPIAIPSFRITRAEAAGAERWLVRMLHAVESLSQAELSQPLLFAVYGRGRAMPPYIGEGITRDNLIGVVGYLMGDCSCQVKEENPGMDLLLSHDWDADAVRLALRIGPETGNEPYLEPSENGAASGEGPLILAEGGDQNSGGLAQSEHPTGGSAASGPSFSDDLQSSFFMGILAAGGIALLAGAIVAVRLMKG